MQKVNLKNIFPVQTNFIGNGAVYHGFAGMPDDAGRVYTAEQCELEADRIANMKLKITRTYYGAYAWEPETKTWNWENDRMKAFYTWLGRMKDRGISVALNIGWWSGADINGSSGSTYGAMLADTLEERLQNYGNWVSESLHQMIELRGFTNIKVVVLFTEPQTDYEMWLKEARAAHEALVRDNRRHLVKLMGPNAAGMDSKMVQFAAEHAADILDIYSCHDYQMAEDLPMKYRRTGRCSPMATIPGGRVQQVVKLKKQTNYTMKMVAAFHSDDPLHVSGNILYGAFDTHYGCVLAGGDPTSRISQNSVKMLDPAEMPDEYKEYSFTFYSGEKEEAIICFFYDVKRQGGDNRTFDGLGHPISQLYVDSMHLYQEGSDQNLLVNPEFGEGYQGWEPVCAGGSMDAYYEWYRWGCTGIKAAPADKPFIFDEYNTTYSRDNSRLEHGANICLIAVALMNSGVSGSLLWTAIDQQWPNWHIYNDDAFYDGEHRCGTMPVLNKTLVPHTSYYAFSLLSRYTGGEGSVVYEGVGGNNLHATMNVLPDGTVTVVVVNNKPAADDFVLTFEKELGVLLHRHLFDPNTLVPDETARMIPADKTVEIRDRLEDAIPAYGVAVYTTSQD